MGDDERRRSTRYGVWFPMQLSSEGDVILAVTRDVSAAGVAMVAAARPEVGAEAKVTIQLPDDAQRELRGAIVRVEPNESDEQGLWRYRVAIAFEEAVPELEPVLERLATPE